MSDLPQLQTVPYRVLFVCTGNTCRSPSAEAIARSEAARRKWSFLEFGSAGTFAFPGAPASELAGIVAARHGLDLESHRARELVPSLIKGSQLVLGMGPAHLEIVRELQPDVNAALLTSYLPSKHPKWNTPVPDPAGGTLHDYEATFELLRATVQGLLDCLAKSFEIS